jgi:hypothetical protein
MSKYLSSDKSQFSNYMVALDIYTDRSKVQASPVTVYVDIRDADAHARKMSMMLVDTGSVEIVDQARIRAVYKAGKRIAQRGMRDFYEMTEAEYAECQILCSETHVYF